MSRPGARARRRQPPRARLAYLVMRFPTYRETFVLREMAGVEASGVPIDLYVVRPQREEVDHPGAREFAARMRTTGWLSPSVVAANVAWLARRPGAYLRVVATIVRENVGAWNLLLAGLVATPKAAWFARDMQRRGIRHVHAHFATHAALMAWVVHRLTGIGYSFTAHAHDIYIQQHMLRRKSDEASFVVTVSEYNRELLARLSPGASIEVVRCGVPTERFAPAPRAPVDRAGARAGFRVVTVAGLQPYKGVDDLLRAAALARTRIPGLSWVVIGDGEQRRALEALAAALGLDGVVTFTGNLDEAAVAAHLHAADAFALTSVVLPDGRREGLPVALMEALAAGLPTVATDVSGVRELVHAGTGWLVPPREPAAVAGALAEIAADPRAAAARAYRGRALVLAEYDAAVTNRRLAARFAAVLG